MLRGQVVDASARPAVPPSVIARGGRALGRLRSLMADVVFGSGLPRMDARDVQSYFCTTDG